MKNNPRITFYGINDEMKMKIRIQNEAFGFSDGYEESSVYKR